MIKIFSIPIILFLASISVSVLGQGEYLWTKPLTSTFTSGEFGEKDIIVDEYGHSYVTASYKGTVLDTTGTLSTPSNEYNVLIAKIDPYGNFIWVHQLSGPYDDIANAITIDNNLNCYITGSFRGSLILDGTFIEAAANSYDQFYVLKFDFDGNLLWHFTPEYSTVNSKLLDIEVDDEENCFVVGSFRGFLKLGNDTLLNTGESGLIVKLDSEGSLLWYKQLQSYYGYENGTDVTQIIKAGYNEYYIGANFRSHLILSDTTIYTVSLDLQYQDALIAKINDQGDFIWKYTFGVINPSSNDAAVDVREMATNDAGELFLAGTFGGANTGLNLVIDTFSMNNGWNEDIYFAKFSAYGNCIWAKSVSGGNNPDYPHDLDITPQGNILISATMSQTNVFEDTTISGLQLNHKGTFSVSPIDGSLVHYENSYPSGDALTGNPPRYDFDAYGNKYTFGNANSFSGENFKGLYINKKSSDDIYFSGTVFLDQNLDSLIDSNEVGLPNIIIIGDSGMFYKTTDDFGGYDISLDTSAHKFELVLPQYYYINYPLNPAYYSSNSPYPNDSILNQNFALAMIPGITDLRLALTSTSAVPGFQTKFKIDCKNIGTDSSLLGSIMLIYHDTLTFISSSLPYTSHLGDTLIWTYDSLLVGEEILIDVNFNVPPEVDLIGQTLSSTAIIVPSLADTNFLNNFDTLNQTVIGAFDPNYKSNDPKGLFEEGYITENDSIFEYEIQFQNTGSDSAVNIVLVDTLPTQLNVSSFEMLSASHEYSYQINGPGIVKWTFANIMLPDSSTNLIESQGFVKFKINVKKPNLPGTKIENRASIFFDFNPPILTNTVLNTVYKCYDIPLYLSNTILCENDTLIAYSLEGSNHDYSWSIDSVLYTTSDTLFWLADSSANFVFSLKSNSNLCSRDTSVLITVSPSYYADEGDEFICQGDSILIFDTYRNTPGTYEKSFQTIQGCDSIFTKTLHVDPTYLIEDSTYYACQGDSVLIFDIYRNISGTYADSLQTLQGCDSIITKTLYIEPTYLIEDSTYYACQGDSVLIYGLYQLETGTYYDSLISFFGCDSIVYSNLTITPCLGIDEHTKRHYTIYPNPGNGIYTIEFNGSLSENVELKVFDINSKLMIEEMIPKDSKRWILNLYNAKDGIYFLDFFLEKDHIIERIIKL
jgi:uncharacterized repeat protein (TIGR01451 family)